MLLYQRQPPQRNCQIVKLPLWYFFLLNFDTAVIRWTAYLKLIQSQLPFRIVNILTYPFHYKKAFAFLNFLYPLTNYFPFAG